MEVINVKVGSPSQVNASLQEVNIQTGGTARNAVLYDPQNLTNAQKQQARENINAADKNEIPTKTSDLTDDIGYAKQEYVEDLSAEVANYIKNDLDWFGKGAPIPANADLDTYRTAGKFYCSSESRAETLVNCPTKSNFCMFVFYRTDYMSQLIITLTGKAYIRSRTSSTWRSWVAYTTSEEIIELTNSIKEELQAEVESMVGEFSVQSDWLQSDSANPDYIKNKPFGIELVNTHVFEGPIDVEYDSNLEYSYATIRLGPWTPSIGEKYLVVIDDESRYEMTIDNDWVMREPDVPVVIGISIENGNFEVLLEPSGTYNLAIFRIDEKITKIDEEYLPDELLEKVDTLSEEINGGIAEIFYTETGEEHLWDSWEQMLEFDLSTPLVAGKEYKVTIDGIEYTVTATEEVEEYENDEGNLSEAHYVQLDNNTGWQIRYGKDYASNFFSSSYNTLYFPAEKYWGEESDEGYSFVPHSLKIEQKVKSLKEIAESTIELNATYEDNTTATLILYGEVKV